jgi:hypothetical protein
MLRKKTAGVNAQKHVNRVNAQKKTADVNAEKQAKVNAKKKLLM